MTEFYLNPELEVLAGNSVRWNTTALRRHSFRNLHRINRYGISLRSDLVLRLEKNIDHNIGQLPEVQALTGSEAFCGMAVARGQELLYEKYARDFGPNQPHTIMSISKTTLNLIVGRLVAEGMLDLGSRVRDYLPDIGSGYADATLQQVMDMDVVNDYSEDYGDPFSSCYAHETALGWRLQGDDLNLSQRDFLARISSDDIVNHDGEPQYKSANSDVMGWIVEEAGGRPLRDWLLEIAEAAGFEQALYCGTDRAGMPVLSGGICLTLRDLVRYGLLFARRGAGVANRRVGDADFIEQSRQRASLEYPPPRQGMYYSNQFYTNRRWVGHGGWGGQFLLANLETGVVCAIFSVLQNRSAYDADYSAQLVNTLGIVSESL